ncbi:MAG: hypothetical protein IKF19_04045 [Bacilli bacterium]|nr:hypothetical protein [Bacilli bacterium]
MKNKRKKAIIGIICLIIIIILSSTFLNNRKNNSDNIKKIIYNKNKSFNKEQTIKGITFSDIECSYDGKDSLISYTISNQTDEDINLKNYKILVKDKKGMVITNIFIDFDKTMKPKQKKRNRSLVVEVDLSKAHSMDLQLNTNNKE